jgi:hypothetical protein
MGPEDKFEIECAPNLGYFLLPNSFLYFFNQSNAQIEQKICNCI